METRASHIVIGGFVLIGVIAAFAVAVWLARVEISAENKSYDIFFTGSVAGLGLGGDVRYRGIKIGRVSEIAVDPDDPGRVQVTIDVAASNPIRQGDVAQLNSQGITGVAFVNIEGAKKGSAPLIVAEGKTKAVIPSKASQFERLFQGAPDLIGRGIELADLAAELLNTENQALITDILRNIAEITAALGSRRDRIERIIDAMDETSGDVAETARNLREISAKADLFIEQANATLVVTRGILSGADGLMENEVRGLIVQARDTAKSIDRLAREAEGILSDNRGPLGDFSAEGLSEFRRFISEARILVSGMARVTERFEADGARFLFGDRESEFTAQ